MTMTTCLRLSNGEKLTFLELLLYTCKQCHGDDESTVFVATVSPLTIDKWSSPTASPLVRPETGRKPGGL
jgi:hypothetical protein